MSNTNKKETKNQKIARLERKVLELSSSSIPRAGLFIQLLEKFEYNKALGSGILIEISGIGGKYRESLLIRDGLSQETIDAIKKDIDRSVELTKTGL